MTAPQSMTRRDVLKTAAVGAIAAPFVFRHHATAAPSETVLHASIGAGGMAASDIGSLTGSKNLKLVAVADVDESRFAEMKKRFPDLRVYTDWRELLDKEKKLDSINISTPDHMHAPATMCAMQQGLHVYTQKPLTQTIYEARQLARVAAEKKLISQMGIQIHSHPVHKLVVKLVTEGAIGKVKEVHSWSGKHWGDRAPRPEKSEMPPANLHWDLWLGVASERPFIGGGYYHPGNWRKRLDFGTGTFGDMGCHILDPVFGSLGEPTPVSALSSGGSANEHNWGLDAEVKYTFKGTKSAVEGVTLTWYDGDRRPPAEVQKLVVEHLPKTKNKKGEEKPATIADQGSIYIGENGVLYSPYIGPPLLLPAEKFTGFQMPKVDGDNHYLQFVEAVRGNGKTSAPFAYAGPLTEMVLLGCLATRFPKTLLEWDAATMKMKHEPAQAMVRRTYRKGWEVSGL